jgi:hypothetical protein
MAGSTLSIAKASLLNRLPLLKTAVSLDWLTFAMYARTMVSMVTSDSTLDILDSWHIGASNVNASRGIHSCITHICATLSLSSKLVPHVSITVDVFAPVPPVFRLAM